MAESALFQWLRRALQATWGVILVWSLLIALSGRAAAQDPLHSSTDLTIPESLSAVSGNPASTTFATGTGWLGRTMGLKDEWGITLGGLWLADTNLVAAGGVQKGGWTSNSALTVGLGVDANKLVGWRGASFGVVGSRPFERTELFQAWYAQEMIKDVLKMRIGRSTPSADFNNVLRPVTFVDRNENIPAVSGLLYSPVFVNGALETMGFTTTPEDMLTSMTRIIGDRSVGELFFGNYKVMDFELMGGDGRKTIISEMQRRGKQPVLPPAVPFGSRQWPALVTPGPGPTSLDDLK
jgi:carbohydrate-selective porin OprB